MTNKVFEERLNKAETDEKKAEIIAERQEELEERRERLEKDYNDSDEVSDRVQVSAEARGLEDEANGTAEEAEKLPVDVLERNGVNVTALQMLRGSSSDLTGQEVASIARTIGGPPEGVGRPESVENESADDRTDRDKQNKTVDKTDETEDVGDDGSDEKVEEDKRDEDDRSERPEVAMDAANQSDN